MSLEKYTHSVLQDWVMELPLREQGTLLTGIRGCDLAPKNPGTIDERYGCSTGECTVERSLSAFLRYCVLNAADPREVDVQGAWFQSKPPEDWKPSQLGHYPLHWYSHLMHCFEVIAYRHPSLWDTKEEDIKEDNIAAQAHGIYIRLVKNLHLMPETRQDMIDRLSEDRIAIGEIVS